MPNAADQHHSFRKCREGMFLLKTEGCRVSASASEEKYDQNIPRRPAYPAGSAGYIALLLKEEKMSTKGTDIAAIIGKGLLGAIPFVGPLAAEIIGAIIPNQRIDRIESLLKLLESKIPESDRPKVKQNIYSPESIDLIEDGFIQASRALSEERKEYIASLLKNSLTEDQVKHIEYKRLLSVLGELNDLEVLILKAQTLHNGQPEHQEFWEMHEGALTPPMAHMGSSQEEIDKHTIYQTHKLHLANLGLLKARFKKPKRGELPEFDDKTGMIKSQGYDITNLGRLLLRSIDQGSET